MRPIELQSPVGGRPGLGGSTRGQILHFDQVREFPGNVVPLISGDLVHPILVLFIDLSDCGLRLLQALGRDGIGGSLIEEGKISGLVIRSRNPDVAILQ